MVLKCLGSSSAGNCYLLDREEECLVIEAGLPLQEVKKALDFNVRKIVGVVVSHVHGDHARYVSDYEKAGIPVFKPYEHEDEMKHNNRRYFGGFEVRAFPLFHDVPTFGFYIIDSERDRTVYISDTEYCKYNFLKQRLNTILIEANYDKALLCEAGDDSVKKTHVLTGHMELQTTKDFVLANDNPELRTVCLLHLSEHNSDKARFRDTIQKITAANVYVAEKGLQVELSLPF